MLMLGTLVRIWSRDELLNPIEFQRIDFDRFKPCISLHAIGRYHKWQWHTCLVYKWSCQNLKQIIGMFRHIHWKAVSSIGRKWPVPSFTKKVNPRSAKRQFKTNGHLANHGLSPFVKRPLSCNQLEIKLTRKTSKVVFYFEIWHQYWPSLAFALTVRTLIIL